MKRTVQATGRHVERDQAEAAAMAIVREAWAGQDFFVRAVDSAWIEMAGEWSVMVRTSNESGVWA